MSLLIQRLERGHLVEQFDCGDQELNDYLRRFAWQNQQRHSVGTTFVATASEVPKAVLGFCTFAASSIAAALFPEVPVLLLGRLAVDQRFQGRGVGSELLAHALDQALAVRETIGCRGIVVDAYPAAASWYAAAGFVPVATTPSEARTKKMFLDLRKVEKAKRGS